MENDSHSLIDNNFVNKSSSEFVTFQTFSDRNSAMELIYLLEENQIPFVLDEFFPFHNPLFSSEKEAIKEFHVQLQKESFPKVQQLLLNINREELESVASDYYLFAFSDQELLDIIEKSYEWSAFDYLLALKLLQERGVKIDVDRIVKIKEEKLEELAKPEKDQGFWIYIGYILALISWYFLPTYGGITSLIIGVHLYTSKKTLPNGDRIFTHSKSNRIHGVVITIIGILAFILFFFRQLGIVPI